MLLSALLSVASVGITSPDSAKPWVPTLKAARAACPHYRVTPAVGDVRQHIMPLGEAPPGRLQYAVLRSVGGCPVPTLVRQTRPAR